MYMNDSNNQNSKQGIFMKYWDLRLKKVDNSQYKNSDIETKIPISHYYDLLNGHTILQNN